MASTALAKQLRDEMQSKFQFKSHTKPRAPTSNQPSHTKKQKASKTEYKTKGSMMKELKQLGLVQGSKGASSWHINNHIRNNRRPSLPQKNDSWKHKEKKPKRPNNHHNNKKHKLATSKHTQSPQPTKKRRINVQPSDFDKLHEV